MKHFPEWTSIYIAAPNIPAAVLRGMARYANVHLYNEQGDVLYATSQLIAVHSKADGQRVFNLPNPVEVVYDLFENKILAEQADRFKVELPPASTALYFTGAARPGVPGSPNTAAGVVLGMVGYMPPEQARGRPVDHRSDQFALGAMLYEMVSGRPPFQRESPVQTLAAIIEDEAEPLSTRAPTFPAPARWIVERCLAKDPAERYASTLDLARELRGVREHLSEAGRLEAVATTAPMRPRGRSRLRRAPGLLAVGALGLGLMALALARDPVRRWADRWTPLPAEKRVAVLPVALASPDPEDQFRSDGLVETLTARLAQLEPYHAGLSVIPATDVRLAGVTTAEAARRTFGATLVVAAGLQRLGDRLRLDARLMDGSGERVLRRLPPEDHPLEALSLQEDLVLAVADLLELPVAAGERRVLTTALSS